MWKLDDPQGNESAKIRWELVPYTRGLGLDLGCGPEKAFPHFIGVDNRKDVQLFGIQMNPDLTVPDCSKLPLFASSSMDFVFSSHLLEHIEDFEAALKEWWRIIKSGGHLCLYVPHRDLYPNIGVDGANPDHKHDFSQEQLVSAMEDIGGWDLLRNEKRDQDREYSIFQVYKKYSDAKIHKHSWKEEKPSKTCGIVRYGAWGDAIQMTSVLPELKAQGFHITFYSTPRAWEVVKEDSHIDKVILQDTDQVPNHLLGEFWNHEKKKYDRWVNLSESVEGTFLALPGRAMHGWPKEVRHEHMNTNYVEFQHKVAQVPYNKLAMTFVPTFEEKSWVAQQLSKLEGDPVMLWVLSGSSVHKIWPHVDQLFARMLTVYPKVRIVTVGDAKCKTLEAPWKNELRIVRRSGEWSIRQTIAFAQQCDVVIGPETGVMSAVAMLPLPKIVFLSHSSHENLTRDWNNTFALFSTKTPCYPCHQLHYDWSHCMRNEELGVAQCQFDIPPDAVWDALGHALKTRKVA